MNIKDMAASRKNLYVFNPEDLHVIDGFNVRDTENPRFLAAQEELVESIKANGVLTPLTVIEIDGRITVTNGHRRLAAVRRAIAEGWECAGVSCILDSKAAKLNEAERSLTLITTNSSHPLEALELAEPLRRMRAAGWDQNQIASRTGFSQGKVSYLLLLADSPENIRQAVRRDELSPTLAVKLVREHGEKAGEVFEAAKNPPPPPVVEVVSQSEGLSPNLAAAVAAMPSGGDGASNKKGKVTLKDVNRVNDALSGTALRDAMANLLEAAVAGAEHGGKVPHGYSSWEQWAANARLVLEGKKPVVPVAPAAPMNDQDDAAAVASVAA